MELPIHQLNTVLKRLMTECNIDDARLAHATGVPFTTIARMRSNPEANPTASSLRPLAHYFSVSISQLLGDEPLSPDRLLKTTQDKTSTATRVPMIDWESISHWAIQNKPTFKDIAGWVSVDLPLSASSFAVQIEQAAYGAALPPGTVLIVDPSIKATSGDIVLLQSEEDPNVLLKEILFDGQLAYLKSVNPELTQTITLSEPYHLCGVVVESRKTLHTRSFNNLKHRSKQHHPEAEPIEG